MQAYFKLIFPLILASLCYFSAGCSSSETTAEQAETTADTSTETPAVAPPSAAPTTPVSTPKNVTPDTIRLPSHLQKIGEASGDLNKDGVAETVLVVEDLNSGDEDNRERRIHIYRRANEQWELWQDAAGGVLGSGDGGMMGDPFDGITIERGVILIKHFGGSRQKWSYLHRFRYQHQRWELIGATITFGAPCDSWETYDYNLSTSNIEAEKTLVNCDTDEDTIETYTFKHTTKPLPTLNGFTPGETQVKLPENKGDFYF